MQIEKITSESIKKAVEILKHGGTVVYPTETAYALGCNAANSAAMRKIFKIKSRLKEKSLPVICATKKMVKDFFKFGKIERKLAKKYWPGALTIILQSAVGSQQLAVRVSSNKIARNLARKLGRPIISTSANISGRPASYNAKEIAETFSRRKYQPDLILDAGKLPLRKPSTIVKIQNKKILILRQGEVKI